MNIYVLAETPAEAARYHNDRHVIKMILESAQILSTAHVYLDGALAAKSRVPLVLRPTHINHPCVQWARASAANYTWLCELARELCIEYNVRYNKTHSYVDNGLIQRLITNRPLNMPLQPLTPFAQCMPRQFTDADAVVAYRRYYFNEKAHIATWTVRGKPHWWNVMELEYKNKYRSQA